MNRIAGTIFPSRQSCSSCLRHLTGHSAEAAELHPEIGPGPARPAADEDIRVVPGLLVADAVAVAHAAGELAALEQHLNRLASEPEHDQRLWRRIAVAA